MKTKRKSLIPKNIATMTDSERYAWQGSLSCEQQDKLCDRTFKGPPEWFLYAEPVGGARDLLDVVDSIEDAKRWFDDVVNDPEFVAVEVKKYIGHYNVFDASLQDRDYTTAWKRGEFTEFGGAQ